MVKMSNDKVEEVLQKAIRLIDRNKRIMRILYQLAFIVTSYSPDSNEARQILEEMKELGLVTQAEIDKAIEDVQRWRDLVLDKAFLRRKIHESI